MALIAIDTYKVVKNGEYDKTILLDDVIKINKDMVVMYKELELHFAPGDRSSEEVAKVWLVGGTVIIVKRDSI